MREWTFTLPSEFPFWELESQWTPKSSKSDCKGQNLLNQKNSYIIRNLLECKYLKWVWMTHFGHFKHKLWPKERSGVKLPIWLSTIKSGNRPNFLVCGWHATYHWKALNEGYNFALDLISIEGLHTKLWAPKVLGVLTLGILGLPLRNLGTKWHLGAGSVVRHKVYYKGEGGGFP